MSTSTSTNYSNILASLGGLNVSKQPSATSFSDSVSTSGTLWTVAKYLGITLFVAFLVLLIVHYAYTPIFNLSPGDGGIIPLGIGSSDAQLIWTDGPAPASVKSTFNNLLPCGFTLQMDLFIDRNLQLSNTERVVLYRANKPIVPDTTGAKTIIQNYPETNLVVYLQKDTNDLVVSSVTQSQTQLFIESAPTMLNAPLKQPFRVTVVYLPNLLEVYVNGRFRGSRVLKNPPLNTISQFYAAPDAFQNTIKIMNLSYWNRPLLAREIAKTAPAMPSTDLFKPSDAAVCAT
jgi:hypothetical protein